MVRGNNRLGERTGFTMVEILIVIAIISVLIALLLPTVNRAMEQARNLKCAVQLQQLGVAAAAYVDDNRQFLFPYAYSDRGVTVMSLPAILSGYIPTNMKTTIWTCPVVYGVPTQGNPLTYACNTGVHPLYAGDTTGVTPQTVGYDAAGHPYRNLGKITALRRGSELVTMADCSLSSGAWTEIGEFDNTYTNSVTQMYTVSQGNQPVSNPIAGTGRLPGWDNTDTGNYHVRYRHLKDTSANCLFLDGHVQSFLFGELLAKNFATGY